MFDPKDSKTTGYHLFLIPPAGTREVLEDTIATLAEEYGSISFIPHLTLLARIPSEDETRLMQKTKQLAGLLKQVQVELDELCIEDAYYRALYLKAQPSLAIDEFHQKALEVFDLVDLKQFMPHVSLYYGNTPQSVKEKMIKAAALPLPISCTLDTVSLYKTDGDPHQWTYVADYNLGV